jgi:hypothetical protein
MKKFLIGLAGVAALAVPSSAIAGSSGYGGVSLGSWSDDAGDDATDVSVGGALAADLTGGWRIQIDGEVSRLSEGGSSTTFQNLAAHVYTGDKGWAAGAVLKSEDLGISDILFFGLEGQYWIGPVALEAELGIGRSDYGPTDASTQNLSIGATWYVTPNASLGASYDYREIDFVDNEIDSLAIEGEYRFDASQISLFGGYVFTTSENTFSSTDIDVWRIGARFHFDTGTLQDRRQEGPRWLLDTGRTAL